MKRLTFKPHTAIVLSIGLWLAGPTPTQAHTPRDEIETLRADLKADRKALIAQNMDLTKAESEAFWPLYRSYRAEVDKVTDRIVKLVLEYADLYPNLPEKRAREMLNEYTKVETELGKIKRKYLKRFGKALPASKVFRFAQLDNRYDLGTRVGLAAAVPILPARQSPPMDTQK